MASYSTLPNGRTRATICIKRRRKTRVFDTEGEATQWAVNAEATVRAAMASNQYIIKFDAALERYAKEKTPDKKAARWERTRINYMRRMPIAQVPMNKLGLTDVHHWRDLRLAQVSPSSVRREWAIMRPVIVHAFEWNWLETNPIDWLGNADMPPEGKPRDRIISENEIQMMRECIDYAQDDDFIRTNSQHQSMHAALLAIETGMRQREVCTLYWEQIDIDGREVQLQAWQCKNNDPRSVPLSSKAVKLLEALKPRKTGDAFKISASTCSTNFRLIRRRVDIHDIVFHDTRHTAITKMLNDYGIPPDQVAKIVGHSDLQQLMEYNNPSSLQLAAAIDKGAEGASQTDLAAQLQAALDTIAELKKRI